MYPLYPDDDETFADLENGPSALDVPDDASLEDDPERYAESISSETALEPPEKDRPPEEDRPSQSSVA